jgi:sigma-B regulation protein RsbU (phosphoserine phosphatase)
VKAPEFNVARMSVWTRILIGLAAVDAVLLASGALGALASLLTDALALIAIFAVARYLIRQSRVLWRVRNRLIVTYVFIAVVPILLILALVGVSVYIVAGQVASYLVTSEANRRAASLAGPARILSELDPARRGPIVNEMIPFWRDRMPGLQVLVTGLQTLHSPPDSTLEPPPSGWKPYTGLVRKDGQFYFMSLARSGDCQVVMLAPLSRPALTGLFPSIGEVSFVFGKQRNEISGSAARGAAAEGEIEATSRGTMAAGSVPLPFSGLDYIDFPTTWFNFMEVADWQRPGMRLPAYVEIVTRPSAVLTALFSQSSDLDILTTIFIGIAIALLVVELISLVIGVSLTRSITMAVGGLYEGTTKIGAGEFSYRIPVTGKDQLAALGTSFNQMSSQLEKLVSVAKEKERLQSELEIASEVQNQLFPRCPPPMRTIQMTGLCHPARMVSGDYYDYLCLPNGALAMAIGDVAGKGISAALLMAAIQSIMRTQLAAGAPMTAAAGGGSAPARLSTAGIVGQLNRQLYANTSPEKYATFFFSLYDENTRLMTYTNAGHLPPMVMRRDHAQLLEVTGTVVGAFPSISYQEKSIELRPDDLLVAYTDGITEPENAYGEEFGADRLADTLRRNQHREPEEIAAKVMEAVRQWSNAPELPDDMTLVVMRGLA